MTEVLSYTVRMEYITKKIITSDDEVGKVIMLFAFDVLNLNDLETSDTNVETMFNFYCKVMNDIVEV